MVPTMLYRLCEESELGSPSWDHLRSILIGGAATTPELLARAKHMGLPVCPTYGMTEACSQITTLRPGSPGPLASSGTALDCVQIQIRDDDDTVLPAGETGQIWIQGTSVSREYVGNPDLTQERFHRGWFLTGDRGWLDEAEQLFVTGRRG